MDKMCALEKLCSDMRYSAAGCEFKANELTLHMK